MKRGVILIAAALAFAFISCKGRAPVANSETSAQQEQQHHCRWGINLDTLGVIDSVVGPKDLLSTILVRHGSNLQTAHYVEIASDSTYSVRKLRPGRPYHIVHLDDSAHTPLFMVYDISSVNYVVYSLHDSIYSYLGAIPTDTVTRTARGTVTSSLWNAMLEHGASPELASMLSDVYSWTIDFFGIQPLDSFSVYYEEIWADTTLVGPGAILAANFITGGADHYALRYQYKGPRPEYFDENGTSLRRAFLKAPLSYSRITSRFSNARRHPITKVVRPHHGVDYAAPAGTPVYSIGDGVVTVRGWDSKGGGNYIKIKHNGSYQTTYMHLKGFAKGIAVGTHVAQGQLIGYVGSTGQSTGPHLDFRVYKDGTAIDPLRMDLPAVDPIDSIDMPAFIEATSDYRRLIGLIPADSIAPCDSIK